MEYDFNKIEAKWQRYWEKNQTFKTEDNASGKPKYYVLDMFPYPSGSGLHVGHPLGYIATDIYSRYKRLKGFNVLHPMGYDSFGLPAEQYALQTGQHPAITTTTNIKRYREQLDRLGLSFDWSREIRTSDPTYYKWTQWLFLKFFNSWYNPDTDRAEHIEGLISVFEKEGFYGDEERHIPAFTSEQWKSFNEKERSDILFHFRLAYLSEAFVNWCPGLGTVLANDEVKDGVSERGGFPVVRKLMPQWSMRITSYSERLLMDLDTIDWAENIKEVQRNWIGKSEGVSVKFKLDKYEEYIEVFTTRPDTIFGVSFLTLAPEHRLVIKIVKPEFKKEVEQYIEPVKNKTELERQIKGEVTGKPTGAFAIHPFTGRSIPIWVSEYVLASYGTGAVMGVPAHDSRDYAFAKKFKLNIPHVIQPIEIWDFNEKSYDEKEGVCINSDFLNGLSVKDAIKKASEEIEKKELGKIRINYRLRDAAFGRQRYWGEPLPIYYKNGVPYPLEENVLPLVLPEIDRFQPTEEGEPPLARAKDWKYNSYYDYEYTTMPGWAGSSWYYLRYLDPHNDKEFVSKEQVDYWQNVDLYVGGAEHVTGHLLYVRFWTKFLYDYRYIPFNEPAKKLVNQGMIQGVSWFAWYRKSNNSFISADLPGKEDAFAVRVDISFVKNKKMDIASFKKWRPEYEGSKFILNNSGEFVCTSEIEKMSKSKWNVVNPDEVIEKYGADTMRMYEMFLGPIELSKPWNTQGISGVSKFLRRFWNLFFNTQGILDVSETEPSAAELKALHKIIKKVEEDMELLSFNTSISAFMICLNELEALKCNKRKIMEPLLICLSPFAPHLAEELWSLLEHKESIIKSAFPKFNEKYIQENTFTCPISFNGKLRFTMELPLSLSKEEVEKQVFSNPLTAKWLDNKSVKKIIVVKDKIVNIVV